jgi:hypothetical protein
MPGGLAHVTSLSRRGFLRVAGLAGGIAKVIFDNLRNTTATAEVTNASIDNLKFIADGNADLACRQADALYHAVNGLGEFQGQKVPVVALAHLELNSAQLVTLVDNNFTRLADLRGRPFSVGAAGSGTEPVAVRIVGAAGLNSRTDIQRQQLVVAPSVDAFKDGKIDGFMWVGGLPTAAVLELANTSGRQTRSRDLVDFLPALQQKVWSVIRCGDDPAKRLPRLARRRPNDRHGQHSRRQPENGRVARLRHHQGAVRHAG